MEQNFSNKTELVVLLLFMLLLVVPLFIYNDIIGFFGFFLWLVMALYAHIQYKKRCDAFDSYMRNVISNTNAICNYAIDQLPQIIMVINRDGRLQWFNKELEQRINIPPTYAMPISTFWPELDLTPVWGTIGELTFDHNDVHYKIIHRPVATVDDPNGLLALYIADITEQLKLKQHHFDTSPAIACIQIDNYEEVMQGITEAERSTLSYETNRLIDEWIVQMKGSLRRISSSQYLAIFERQHLLEAKETKFELLDKVRVLTNTRRMAVTISMGIATADDYTIAELDMKAQSELDMALARGGDQVALFLDGKTEFYGGKAKSVEKNTRVKARVFTNSLIEYVNKSDEVFIMGHANEDFDALGAAIGLTRIAKELKKPVHVIVSETHASIDKLLDMLKTKDNYSDILISPNDLLNITAHNPLLILVDTHIAQIVADPDLLERIDNVIIVDHHRRSENYIRNTLLTYQEPSGSSTCEMVTEMLQYLPKDISLSRMEATALYAGILVDTKNFVVQTGVRTFDASSYLRRSGVDPKLIRQLFLNDYETDVAKAKAKANSQLFPNGLITTTCPDTIPNINVIAAQVADSMLRIENVRASIVVFQAKPDTVGISARSTGDINVQVIMEKFGGGGHQNVAGAQVRNRPLKDIYEEVLTVSNQFIEENDKNESNTATGR